MKRATLQRKGGFYTAGNYGRIARSKIDKPRICVGCGEIKGKLYVHHKDGNYANNSIDNLEYRCPHCHREVHPTPFGKNICKYTWDYHHNQVKGRFPYWMKNRVLKRD